MIDHFLYTHFILKAVCLLLDLRLHLKIKKQTVMNYSKNKKHEPTLKQIWFNRRHELKQKLNQQKMLALGIGTAATLLSILMFTYPSFMGIFKRLIFISSFGWMIHFFIKWNKTTP